MFSNSLTHHFYFPGMLAHKNHLQSMEYKWNINGFVEFSKTHEFKDETSKVFCTQDSKVRYTQNSNYADQKLLSSARSAYLGRNNTMFYICDWRNFKLMIRKLFDTHNSKVSSKSGLSVAMRTPVDLGSKFNSQVQIPKTFCKSCLWFLFNKR